MKKDNKDNQQTDERTHICIFDKNVSCKGLFVIKSSYSAFFID